MVLLLFFSLKRCFSFSSLNFYCKGCSLNLRFALMQKKQKIKPENQKLENYLEAPLRSPSRSSFVLNSRTAAAALLRCFLCFLFKGGLGVTLWSVQFSGSSVQLLLGIFSFSLMQKKQKLFTRYYCFFWYSSIFDFKPENLFSMLFI